MVLWLIVLSGFFRLFNKAIHGFETFLNQFWQTLGMCGIGLELVFPTDVDDPGIQVNLAGLKLLPALATGNARVTVGEDEDSSRGLVLRLGQYMVDNALDICPISVLEILIIKGAVGVHRIHHRAEDMDADLSATMERLERGTQ